MAPPNGVDNMLDSKISDDFTGNIVASYGALPGLIMIINAMKIVINVRCPSLSITITMFGCDKTQGIVNTSALHNRTRPLL
jgi:hypothetical protein